MHSEPVPGIEATTWELHWIVLPNGDRPVADFLADLEGSEQDNFGAVFEKILSLPLGTPLGSTFKRLTSQNNVWQASTYDHRILGFRTKRTVVLTNGFKKTRGETPPEEIKLSSKRQSDFRREHPNEF